MADHAIADRGIASLTNAAVRASAETDWARDLKTVEQRRDLPYDEFMRDYVLKKRPVIVKNGVPKDAVTPQTLRAFCGHRLLAHLDGGGGSFILARGSDAALAKYKTMRTLGEYLQRLDDDEPDLPYLTNLCLNTNFPEIQDAFVSPAYFKPNWITRWPFAAFGYAESNRAGAEVFIAPNDARYGVLHFDRHAVYVCTSQYYGRKTWWLAPPEQTPYMYPVTTGYPHLSPVNPFKPDLEKYPLFAHVAPQVANLEPGDVMFVPGSWWHATKAETANISTVCRVLNRTNLLPYLWTLKWYLLHDWNAAGIALRRALSGR